MRFTNYALVLLIAAAQLAGATVFGQQVALAPAPGDCPPEEPDSIQISWTQPCDEGDWLLDTQAGCRMWDWHPDPKDRPVWSGTCRAGKKEGRGVVQWFEHGQPIDRFEGTYRAGKREGFGRYEWNPDTTFEGKYTNDLPHGFGTARVLGETFVGDWSNGCLRQDSRVVAIGVPRTSCRGLTVQADRPPQAASF